jgi:hypothetical protein
MSKKSYDEHENMPQHTHHTNEHACGEEHHHNHDHHEHREHESDYSSVGENEYVSVNTHEMSVVGSIKFRIE